MRAGRLALLLSRTMRAGGMWRGIIGVSDVVKENTKGIVLFRGVEGVEDGSRWERGESTAGQGGNAEWRGAACRARDQSIFMSR